MAAEVGWSDSEWKGMQVQAKKQLRIPVDLARLDLVPVDF